MSNNQQVILVDENDNVTGSMEKMDAHRKGVLHRAFSVFIFNSKSEMLIQQRAIFKYHSGGLWSNACCSHPNPGEETKPAAERRLEEEMGIRTPLRKIFDFTYAASFENGLTENEFDHVFTGTYDGIIKANPEEVNDYCFKPIKELGELIIMEPGNYTEWFKIAFPKIERWYSENS